MFKEEYIKANEQIKPDDDFLIRLKESIVKESLIEQGIVEGDTVIHIGDYVDLNNATSITEVESVATISEPVTGSRGRITWKNIAVVAACFVFVCSLSFVASKMDLVNNNKGLQAGVESVVNENNELNEVIGDEELQRQYQKVRNMFDTMNVVIYETEEFRMDAIGTEYIKYVQKNGEELSPAQRDELLGNILAEQYAVKSSLEEFDDAKYYVAEFEDQSYVYFVIDSKGSLYIAKTLDVQSMAIR